MKHFYIIIILVVAVITLEACRSKGGPVKTDEFFFAKGGDISWLPQMEASGFRFLNENGEEEDCMKILKDHGFNTIRLRTFVNPSQDPINGHCSKEETISMAARARREGMKVMIDFHYSDSWADPSQQNKPKAWEGQSFSELKKSVYDYTHDFMMGLKTSGIYPEWVQVGNEITNGMIYPEGSIDHWPQLALLINEGYRAVKDVSSASQVILHVDQGNNNQRFRNWFDNATVNNASYDVIGMSYYPYWLDGHPDYTQSINDLKFNLTDMVSRYGKKVMVVETGGMDTDAQDTYQMLMEVQKVVQSVPGNKGLGVLYWEPEGARSWSHYNLSAWGNDGRPTSALKAFLDYK